MNIKDKTKFDTFAIIVISLFAISVILMTFQNDTFYTIKVGESILNNGIDMQDHFSWHENLKYTYPHWLYDLITYIVYSKFDFLGVYILTCFFSIILGITLYFVNKKLCKNDIISFFVSVIVLYFMSPYITARAQLVTYILFVLTIYFIEKYLENKKIIYAIILFIIPVIIANFHAAVFPFYFVLYLPYIAEYIVAKIYFDRPLLKSKINKLKNNLNKKKNKDIKKLQDELKKYENKLERINETIKEKNGSLDKILIFKNDNTKSLIMVMFICVFSGLLTPIGDIPYTYIIRIMGTTSYILEHLPMVFKDYPEALAFISVIILFFTFTKVKLRINDLCFFLGLTILAIISTRQFSMLVIIYSIFIARLLVQFLNNSKHIVTTESLKKSEYIFFVIVSLCMCVSLLRPRIKNGFIDEKSYPVEASQYILQNIDLSDARMYNEYETGSYLLFKGIPVFIDSRCDLYYPKFSGKDEDIFTDYMDTLNMKKYFGDTFEKYGITHLILSKDSSINVMLSDGKDPKYKELYSDNYFVIYEIVN